MKLTDDTQQVTPHTLETWTKEYLPYLSDTGTDIPCYRIHSFEAPEDYICETNEHLDDDVQYANARRICAAVNACKGISTEALERGIIAEIRHVLDELLTAAGDLDTAIDGAINQFDAERAKLTPALRAAQGVLDGGPEFNLHELLAGRHKIAAIWCIEDVQALRTDLTDDQAWEVLQDAQRKHDAIMGISWDTLEILAEELFGPAAEKDA